MNNYSFGEWLRARRDQFRLTRKEVADAAACSVAMLRKIEDDERRPSEELARMLAGAMRIPAAQLEAFVAVARGERPLDALDPITGPDGPPALPSGEPGPRHNIPQPRTPFIGRQAELAALNEFMTRQDRPLMTIAGPGGIGKTRLMLQAARETAAAYAHGVWLVELAPLNDPDLIPERVAAVLEVQEQPGRPMRETLVSYLRPKTLLLLLDNIEHLVQGGAEFVEYLLQKCPALQVVVTSREPLLIEGETTLPLASLAMPLPEQTPEMIVNVDGVKLFLDRARAIRPNFALTNNNAAVIGQIVRRLDGIPLALELAAARLRTMTIDQINGRLNDRFRLLTGGSRTALPRQQTLQALIDWSWNLLEEKEQVLLRRLSIFAGGWQLEAAEIVTGFEPLDRVYVMEGLEQLVNKSLVTVQHHFEAEAPIEDAPLPEARYGLLETIHHYALLKLSAAGEYSALRERYIDYFTTVAGDLARRTFDANYVKHYQQITLDGDNLRTVFGYIKKNRPGQTLRFAGTLLQYESGWLTPREANDWLEPAIARARKLLENETAEIDMTDFIRALTALGWLRVTHGQMAAGLPVLEEAVHLARQQGEFRFLVLAASMKLQALGANAAPENIQEVEEAVAISRREGYEMERIMALMALGTTYLFQNQYEAGKAAINETGRLAETFAFGPIQAWMYLTRARLAHMEGNTAEAERNLLLALAVQEKMKDHRMAATIRSRLAHTYRETGRLDEAEAQYRRTILSWQEQGHQTAVANQIECLAYIAHSRGNDAHAARLLGAAQAARQRLNEPITYPNEVAEYTAVLAQLAETMGEAERDRVMADGERLSLDEAVVLALEGDRTAVRWAAEKAAKL